MSKAKKIVKKKAAKKKAAKVGKPIKNPFVSQENIQLLQSMSMQGMSLEQIAHAFGMSRTALYFRLNEQPELRQMIDEWRSKGVAKISNALFRKAQEGDLQAIIFFLKTKGGYNEKIDHNISGTVDIKVDTVVAKRIDNMSSSERLKRLGELQRLESADTSVIDVEVDIG